MESDISLRENGHPETITFISTVPLFCKQNDKKCKLDMVLSVKYPKGRKASMLSFIVNQLIINAKRGSEGDIMTA